MAKIGHHAKAKSCPFKIVTLGQKLNFKKDARNNSRRKLELFCAKNDSREHLKLDK